MVALVTTIPMKIHRAEHDGWFLRCLPEDSVVLADVADCNDCHDTRGRLDDAFIHKVKVGQCLKDVWGTYVTSPSFDKKHTCIMSHYC